MKYILLLTLFMTAFKTDKKENNWFKVYMKDMEYYAWISDKGNTYRFTDEELTDLMYTYEIWGDTLRLKAIVLRDVE